MCAERTVREVGYRVARICQPGTLDGGDVLKHGGTVYVGMGGRTNGLGIQQLAKHLQEFDVRVQAVTVERALHLKSAVTALPDGTVIGWDPVVDYPGRSWHTRMPENPGARRPPRRHQTAHGGQRAADRDPLRARGYDVTTVDISEFEKLGAA